jgi:hypothetical protein
MGYSIDGGFAEYAVAYGRCMVKVPVPAARER